MSLSKTPLGTQYSRTPASRNDFSALPKSTTSSSDDMDRVRWKENSIMKRSPGVSYSTSSKKQRLNFGQGEALFEVPGDIALEKENDSSQWIRCLDEAAEEEAPRRRQRGLMIRQSEQTLEVDESLIRQIPIDQSHLRHDDEDEFPLDIDEDALMHVVQAVESLPVREYAPDGVFEPCGRSSRGCARMRVVRVQGSELELCELTEGGRTTFISLEAIGFDEPRLEPGDIVHVLALAPLLGETNTKQEQQQVDIVEEILFSNRKDNSVPIGRDSPLALIAHPDLFVSPTTVADATHCDRMAVLRKKVSNGRRRGKPLVLGSLKHECLRLALIRGDHDRKSLVDEVIRRKAADVYAVDGAVEAKRECTEFLNVMVDNWAKKCISTPAPIKVMTRGGGGGGDRQVKLVGVDAAEEPRFAPILGISGNVDLVMKLQEDATQVPRRIPLELKTGSPNISHAAQVSLYVAMDRTLCYDKQHFSTQTTSETSRHFGGLLLYPPPRATHPDSNSMPIMEHVNASVHETRSLLQARNRVANAMVRFTSVATEREAAHQKGSQIDQTPSFLPQVKQEATICSRCFQLKTCAAFHAATEAGNANSFGCGEDVWSKALPGDELNCDADRFYLHNWMRALELEEASATPASRQVLNRSARERQGRGEACLGGLSLSQQSQHLVNEDVSEWRYTLSTSSEREDLTKCALSAGDFVMLSAEVGEGQRRGVTFLDRGNILLIDTKHIEVTTTAKLEHRLPIGSSIRLDKDESTSSTNAARTNVLGLFIDVQNGGDSRNLSDDELAAEVSRKEHRDKLRRLVVRLDRPCFEQSAMETIITPLLDTGTKQSRFGGIGCSAERLGISWTRLNTEQRLAAERALSTKDYALILGMPGTGKTSTIEFVLRCLLARGKRVLVCSHTHAAVDIVLAKLLENDVPKRCVGRLCRTNSAKVLPAVRDCIVNTECNVQQLKAKLAGLRVLGCTCLHAASDSLLGRLENKVGGYFDVVLLDEAGQISQPIALAPLYLAASFILVGDPHQLRPLCRSKLAASKFNADQSLFERLATAHPNAVALLRTQYRMSKPIMDAANAALDGAFSMEPDETVEDSVRFDGWHTARRLRIGSEAIARANLALDINTLPHDSPAWLRAAVTDPFAFIDLPRSEAAISQSSGGATNKFEINLIVRTVKALRQAGAESSAIAILTPFRSQREAIATAFHEEDSTESLIISTIDKYQGSDRDVIIVSLCKNKLPLGDLLADPRRVNVALTRAKKKLILIGTAAFLGEHSHVFQRLVEFANRSRALHTVTSASLDKNQAPFPHPHLNLDVIFLMNAHTLCVIKLRVLPFVDKSHD